MQVGRVCCRRGELIQVSEFPLFTAHLTPITPFMTHRNAHTALALPLSPNGKSVVRAAVVSVPASLLVVGIAVLENSLELGLLILIIVLLISLLLVG